MGSARRASRCRGSCADEAVRGGALRGAPLGSGGGVPRPLAPTSGGMRTQGSTALSSPCQMLRGTPSAPAHGATSCTWFTVGRDDGDPRGRHDRAGRQREDHACARESRCCDGADASRGSGLRSGTPRTRSAANRSRGRGSFVRVYVLSALRVNFAVHSTFVIDPRTGFASYELLAIQRSILVSGSRPMILAITCNRPGR